MAQIFHITEQSEWGQAQKSGAYVGSTRGRTLEDEGFIHCCEAHQVSTVASLTYIDHPDPHQLVVLTIDSELVDVPVQCEVPEPGAEKFPHIYCPLPIKAVTQVRPWLETEFARELERE